MRLSLKAIELCRMKFGKGEFCGFEQNEESVLDTMPQEMTSRDFDELTQNGIIDITDGNIVISLLKLMPEIFRLAETTRYNHCMPVK